MLLSSLAAYGQTPAAAPNLTGRTEARSMVISKEGIVATEQPLASQTGAQILARGGSAADAAIAANAVMGVIEPMMNGMGGDLFAIEWDVKSEKVSGLNSSGWAPAKLTPALLRQKGFTRMPALGIYTVTVPGVVKGWWALHQKYGRLPWAELFKPAIYLAENGFPVAEWDAAYWKALAPKLAWNPAYWNAVAARQGWNTAYWKAALPDLEKNAEARHVYMLNGRAPEVGQVFRNPDYARALRLVAENGPKAFYQGPIAAAILKTSDEQGGVMTAEDLVDYTPQWVNPILTTYRGWTVYEMPPNSQGMAALEMLNIMERFPLADYGFASAKAFQIKIEAQKLAYTDLRRYLGDPRFAKVPVAGIISKSYAAARAKEISLERANCGAEAGNPVRYESDTQYLTAIDKDGNIVSLIQSLYSGFGSGVVVNPYGFMLQNRGAGFVLDAMSPDVLAPRKRPFHTIIPAFMEKGNLHIGFGIMGGLNQAQAQAQFVSDIADEGMNIQQALEAPRFTKMDFSGCDVEMEDRVPADVRRQLSAMGQQIRLLGDFASDVGGGQAVMRDSATGVNYGASDPRKDGEAVPQPGPYLK
ncbi:MAG TPA: gamma-glutamyltransferase family protein [Terriglobia bacterium]|nr:gamma-glutamyltransferase family protein [Terriglobia bacterium]